jgi:hypothetical protein
MHHFAEFASVTAAAFNLAAVLTRLSTDMLDRRRPDRTDAAREPQEKG